MTPTPMRCISEHTNDSGGTGGGKFWGNSERKIVGEERGNKWHGLIVAWALMEDTCGERAGYSGVKLCSAINSRRNREGVTCDRNYTYYY